jgi:hypothetical protein
MIAHAWRMPWSTLAGIVIGVFVVLVTPTWVGPLRDAYDSSFPVLRMSGTVVARDDDSVTLHIRGEKLRGEECRLLSVYGYAVGPSGRLSDATATRVDQQPTARVRDAGDYDIGHWRVRPVTSDAVAVKVVAQHDCVGRVVLSTIAEANL